MTRNAIEYNLKDSPFIFIVDYGNEERVEFHFSSKLHKLKFMKFYESNRLQNKEYLKKKFGFSIYINEVADINLYKVIESRGFYLTCKGVEYTCQTEIILTKDGLRKALSTL